VARKDHCERGRIVRVGWDRGEVEQCGCWCWVLGGAIEIALHAPHADSGGRAGVRACVRRQLGHSVRFDRLGGCELGTGASSVDGCLCL
jgi:hypothetical protein